MNTENWSIEYFLGIVTGNTDRGMNVAVLYVSEIFPLPQGYHKRVEDWLAAVKESAGESPPHEDLEKMLHPLYSFYWHAPEQGTSLKMISLTIGDKGIASPRLNLPLHPALRTAEGRVLLTGQHPITLIAPDGTRYTATQI